MTATRKPLAPPARAPQGVVTLELLLVLPVVILFLLAVIQFALIYEVDKRVGYASRFGAKVASETTRDQAAAVNLGNLATIGELRRQVDVFLATAGLGGACGVILEHNACLPGTVQTDIDAGCVCPAPADPLPGGEPNGPAYVRVTVCLPLDDNLCDLLPSFGGFSLADKTLRHSTTFRIERDNQPPDAVLTMPLPALAGGVAVPPLPISSPPTGAVSITFPGPPPALLGLSFNALASTDPEQPFSALTFNWAADTDGNGGFDTLSSGTTFAADFVTPAPGAASVHAVRLTVTDGCNATDTAQVIITLTSPP